MKKLISLFLIVAVLSIAGCVTDNTSQMVMATQTVEVCLKCGEIKGTDLCCKAEDIPAARVAAAQSAILAKRTSQAVPKAASPLA